MKTVRDHSQKNGGCHVTTSILFVFFILTFPAHATNVSRAGSFLSVAQLPATTSAALGSWLIQFMAVMVIVISVLQILSFFKRRPPIDAEFATKKELNTSESKTSAQLEGVRKDVGAIKDQMRVDYDNIQRSGEARASAIHNRINDMAESFGEVRGTVNLLAKRFGVGDK